MFSLVFLLLCCFPLCTTNASRAYNETLARYEMFQLASAAYSDNPERCLENTSIKVIQTWKVSCFNNSTCLAYLARVKCRAIAIAFSGTRTDSQLVAQAASFLLGYLYKPDFYGTGGVNYLHKDIFDELFLGDMENATRRLVKKHPKCDIWGGALASLAAQYIVLKGIQTSNKVLLYTYGQPRVGGRRFAKAHDTLVPNSYRITHGIDPVVELPMKNLHLDWTDHLAKLLKNYNGERYYHHKREIHYPDDMSVHSKYIECVENEDEQCAIKTDPSSTSDLSNLFTVHKTYFGKNFGSWCERRLRPLIKMRPM